MKRNTGTMVQYESGTRKTVCLPQVQKELFNNTEVVHCRVSYAFPYHFATLQSAG
jgi:hypothetical protein